MFKGFKYRIYPNKEQRIMFAKSFGCVRFFYNYALNLKIDVYKKNKKILSRYDLQAKLPELKNKFSWLKEVSAQSLQMCLIALEVAYKRFFREKHRFPKFKSKHSKQAFQVYATAKIDWEQNRISIPKIKNIKIKLSRKFDGIIKQVTISKTSAGKYFISLVTDNSEKLSKKFNISKNNAVGVDLGLTHYAILSTGEKINNPQFLKKKLRQLKIAQRKASKKKKGSKNRKKANLKTARIHEKIFNKRQDFLHKTTSALISKNQTICVEKLNVKGMMKNQRFAQGIGDVSWSEFIRQLEYKADWYGKNLIKVDPKNTSKMCSSCGFIKKDLRLEHRSWKCSICYVEHDRDVNAAINILRRGTADVKPVEKTCQEDSAKQEVNSRQQVVYDISND
jgi:putative transposase